MHSTEELLAVPGVDPKHRVKSLGPRTAPRHHTSAISRWLRAFFHGLGLCFFGRTRGLARIPIILMGTLGAGALFTLVAIAADVAMGIVGMAGISQDLQRLMN